MDNLIRPTIVIVPGAWHVPGHFHLLTSILSMARYKVIVVRNPTVRMIGPYPSSYEADAFAVQSILLTEAEAENDIVLLMHSYGGMPGSLAARGLSKDERAVAGLKGGIVRLVYVAAIAADEGATIRGILEAAAGDAGSGEVLSCIESDGISTFFTGAERYFFHDVPEPHRSEAIALLQRQSAGCQSEPQQYAAWKVIPSTYIICGGDKVIPVAVQEYLSSQPGGKWSVERMKDVGHSPFLSKPRELAYWLNKIALQPYVPNLNALPCTAPAA